MSAIVIDNPDNLPGAVSTGYQLQNTILISAMTGIVNVSIDKTNRYMVQGSVFELNGNIVRVTANENIMGIISTSSNNINYSPYAKPYFTDQNILKSVSK